MSSRAGISSQARVWLPNLSPIVRAKVQIPSTFHLKQITVIVQEPLPKGKGLKKGFILPPEFSRMNMMSFFKQRRTNPVFSLTSYLQSPPREPPGEFSTPLNLWRIQCGRHRVSSSKTNPDQPQQGCAPGRLPRGSAGTSCQLPSDPIKKCSSILEAQLKIHQPHL